jgi:HPt (histidine-containing phosphotransfer) domain-containing protein
MKAIHSLCRNRTGEPAEEGSSGPGTPARPALDVASALERVGGDEVLLRELVVIFVDDYPRQLGLIEEAISHQDWKTAERESHGLKGAVANFSAPDAVEASRKVEFAAREGHYEELPLLMEQLREELSRVRTELDRLTTQ